MHGEGGKKEISSSYEDLKMSCSSKNSKAPAKVWLKGKKATQMRTSHFSSLQTLNGVRKKKNLLEMKKQHRKPIKISMVFLKSDVWIIIAKDRVTEADERKKEEKKRWRRRGKGQREKRNEKNKGRDKKRNMI
jgi:hypothetical protein